MYNLKKTNKQINEKGQSMIELAVSLVILLILLAGVVDLGRLAFYYLTMRDAAQEGASYGSIFPNNNEQIFARVIDGIGGDGIDPSRIVITLSRLVCPTSDPKDCVLEYTCISTQTCAGDPDTSDTNISSQNIVSVGDVIEITVTDSAFPITMPLLGTYIGKQEIVLETTIKDNVIRIPKN